MNSSPGNHDNASHLCVFGVGGVGGYFGGKIAAYVAEQHAAGWNVHFVARGEHLAQIKRDGLILNTPGSRLVCWPQTAAESMDALPEPDVVLLCVKSYGLTQALEQIAAHCHENTVVIPLLNGIDIHERTREHLHDGLVLPSCVFVGTHVSAPGVISQEGGDGIIFMGADPDHPEVVPEGLLQLLGNAGIDYRWFTDSRQALWEKYLFIAAFGLVTAASARTLKGVLADTELTHEVKGIMTEVVALADHEGIVLGPQAVQAAVEKAEQFPVGTKTSLQRDVEAGRAHEGDLFGGTIVRLGIQYGIPTPFTRRVYERIGING